MNGKFYIYKTTNLLNEKIYIGMHYSENIENDPYMGSGTYIKKAIKKYGSENFSREILFEYDNSIDASNKERELVNEEFLKGHVYNVSLGGFGSGLVGKSNPFFGKKHTDETRAKLSKAHMGKTLSETNKENISKSLRNSEKFKQSMQDPNRSIKIMETKNQRYPELYNKPPKVKLTTEERGCIVRNWIENNPEAHKARMNKINKNPEKIRKMAEKQTGRPKTEECKKNISNALIGKNKGADSSEFKGYYITPTGKFESLSDASEKNGCSKIAVRDRCRVKNDNKIVMYSITTDKSGTLTKDMVGKTWFEIGWSFEEV